MLNRSLTNRKISDREYEHVLNVWNIFEMKMMEDYLDRYLCVTFYFQLTRLKHLEIIA